MIDKFAIINERLKKFFTLQKAFWSYKPPLVNKFGK